MVFEKRKCFIPSQVASISIRPRSHFPLIFFCYNIPPRRTCLDYPTNYEPTLIVMPQNLVTLNYRARHSHPCRFNAGFRQSFSPVSVCIRGTNKFMRFCKRWRNYCLIPQFRIYKYALESCH